MMLRWGGGTCFSSVANLTTGNFGEWITEQNGINAACANTSKDYFLNINIAGVDQTPRRRLVVWNAIRKNVNEITNGKIKVLGDLEVTNITDLKGTTNVITNIDIPLVAPAFPSTLLVKNQISNTTAATILRIQNDINKFISIALGSNKTSIANITGSQGTLSYNGGNSFSFSMLNFPTSWIWRNTFAPALNNVSIDKLMELNSNGTLILYHGNLNVNGSINVTGNIIASQNVTADTGFFSYLGSLANRITKLFVQDIDFNGTINGAGSINLTNITAVQYNSLDGTEIKTGLTSSKFRVCDKFNTPSNTCDEWCKLQITGGIITGCT